MIISAIGGFAEIDILYILVSAIVFIACALPTDYLKGKFGQLNQASKESQQTSQAVMVPTNTASQSDRDVNTFKKILLVVGLVVGLALLIFGYQNYINYRNSQQVVGSDSDYTNTYYDTATDVDDEIVEIDLSDYEISLYTDGLSGSGTAYVEVDASPVNFIESNEKTEFVNNPEIVLSKSSGLKNGDIVTVTLSLDEDMAEYYHLEVTGDGEYLFEISNLDTASSSSSKSSSSSSMDADEIEDEIDTLLSNYRMAINQALKTRDASSLTKHFISTTNADYLETKDYIENDSEVEGIARYDSVTDDIYDIEQDGDEISFTLDYTTTIHYTDGRASTTFSDSRDYLIKKVKDQYVIVDF